MTVPNALELETVAAEVEAHVAQSGWDTRPALFALVRADRFAADEPQLAAQLGLDATAGGLTPVEQEALPDSPLDETLARIAWPEGVAGCALSQEIVLLPPEAEDEVGADPVGAAAHPARREARLVAAVLRDGTSAVVLRLREAAGAEPEELLTGPDLAPNLVAALLATFDS